MIRGGSRDIRQDGVAVLQVFPAQVSVVFSHRPDEPNVWRASDVRV